MVKDECIVCRSSCMVGKNASFVYRDGPDMSVICDGCSGLKRDPETNLYVDLVNAEHRQQWIPALILGVILVILIIVYLAI